MEPELSESQCSGAETPQKHIRAKGMTFLGNKETQSRMTSIVGTCFNHGTNGAFNDRHDQMLLKKIIDLARDTSQNHVRSPDLIQTALTTEIIRRERLNYISMTIDKQSMHNAKDRWSWKTQCVWSKETQTIDIKIFHTISLYHDNIYILFPSTRAILPL